MFSVAFNLSFNSNLRSASGTFQKILGNGVPLCVQKLHPGSKCIIVRIDEAFCNETLLKKRKPN